MTHRRHPPNRNSVLQQSGAVASCAIVRAETKDRTGDAEFGPKVLSGRETSTIPIVMTVAGDPLGSGLVESLARPGGNVTGMSLMAPDLGGKRLELLKELLPRLGRVAVLWNATNPYAALVYKQTQAAGRTLGIEVLSLEVRGPDDLEGAFETTRQQHFDALITVEDPLTGANRERIVHFAAVDRLPSLYGNREEVVAGGLMSYGANFADLFRRAAGYVDKILKGVKPAD